MELIMFVGIPASGKSTRSAAYRDQGYLILSSDEIREGLIKEAPLENMPDKEWTNLNVQVFETIRKRTADALKKGQSVVVDATNLSRKRRMSFLKQFSGFSCPKKCVLFITPVQICLERNRKRTGNARVPEEAMQKMLRSFECPNYWEGWDEIIPAADPNAYDFSFEEIRGFEQDNPHHSLTLDAHMAAAAAFCRQQGRGEMLERVAMYHDIGKVYTKQYRNSRGEITPHAHYYGHENYGAYLYLTRMCCGKALSPEEFRQALYETGLINCHMRPLFRWDEEKDRRLFGEMFVSDLLALHQADREAH